MSHFQVPVLPIREIEEHPNADRIELAVIGEYRSIVKKNTFQKGDLVAYIPEAAIVPERVLATIGLVGKLAGAGKNRVKAVRLRGVVSQGIIYPAWEEWEEGQDVAETLGITKYVPPVPTQLSGQVLGAGQQWTLKYDIENWKKYPNTFEERENVVFTEKIHGTFFGCTILPKRIDGYEWYAWSKGLGAKGLVFKDIMENENNVYLRAAKRAKLNERVRADPEYGAYLKAGLAVMLLGEIHGVQDLKYGGEGVRFFDIWIGKRGNGHFLPDMALEGTLNRLGLERVPVLWRGIFDRSVMEHFTDGEETVTGRKVHIREGIVMRSVVERMDDEIGRVQLKSVSDRYLFRGKKGQETTEFE